MDAFEKKKKVLLICYYWPPAGGSGVQRPLKFVKYLRHFGWEPIVYTAKNGEYPEMDSTLSMEIPERIQVIKRPITEPYTFYKFFTGKKQKAKITPNFFTQKKMGLLQQFSIFIRSNFFIPDARMWWIKPSVRFLSDYLAKNPVDAIISTGPPHSLHLIAKELKAELGIPWLADFRDPWTNIDYFKELTLLPFAKEKHKKLEKEVLSNADQVVTVSPTWAEELTELGNRPVSTITNGYDTSDFPNIQAKMDAKFTIIHPGMFSKARNHDVLWETLADLVQENKSFSRDLQLRFYGITDASVMEKAKQYGLEEHVEVGAYVPHNQIVNSMASAWVLLLSVHDSSNLQGFVPGKLFEYMASRRPILCLGPENGDAAKMIKATKSGLVSSFKDKNKLKINLMVMYSDFTNERVENWGDGIEKYSRLKLTGDLAELLDKIYLKS